MFWGGFGLVSFFGGVVVLIFHKRTFKEYAGRVVVFFFGFVSWFVWSLGGGKGRIPIE